MFKPYSPCQDCKRKEMCDKCAHKALQENYHRALNKIIELSAKTNTKITILV